MSLGSDLRQYWGFSSGLWNFLHGNLTLEECRLIVSQRMGRRRELFLDFLENRVFNLSGSPYHRLMDAAGIDFSEVRSWVLGHGVETALERLAERGVYLTVDEFKGRADCVRKDMAVRFKECEFDAVRGKGFSSRSGGSRSSGTEVFIDFRSIVDESCYSMLLLSAHGLAGFPGVVWFPAGLGLHVVLSHTKQGRTPVRWFTQVDWTFQMQNKPLGGFKDSVMKHTMRLVGIIRGYTLPKPEYVPLGETEKIVTYLSNLAGEYSKCVVRTYPSSAVRAAKVARELGINLNGVYFVVGGEPITVAKMREVESCGGRMIPLYASMEAGVVSYGCARPKHPDDTHLLADSHAVIKHRREIYNLGSEVDSLLVTNYLPNASKILLNVEMGDTCIIDQRKCGCGWESIGFETHLHSIRSFEKLTGEGMTIFNSDLVRIMEEVLPARFGGSSTDYQIMEEEVGGFTRLTLIVSPEVGGVEEAAVLKVVSDELTSKAMGSGSSKLSVDVWKKADTLSVRREYPKRTQAGKILSFQINQKT